MKEQGRRPTDAAVREVLEAEHRAGARITEAEEKAEYALQRARAEARRIETDAVAAARAFQASCAEKVEQRLTALRETAEQHLAGIESESSLPRIRAAAGAVARELAGIESGDEEGLRGTKDSA